MLFHHHPRKQQPHIVTPALDEVQKSTLFKSLYSVTRMMAGSNLVRAEGDGVQAFQLTIPLVAVGWLNSLLGIKYVSPLLGILKVENFTLLVNYPAVVNQDIDVSPANPDAATQLNQRVDLILHIFEPSESNGVLRDGLQDSDWTPDSLRLTSDDEALLAQEQLAFYNTAIENKRKQEEAAAAQAQAQHEQFLAEQAAADAKAANEGEPTATADDIAATAGTSAVQTGDSGTAATPVVDGGQTVITGAGIDDAGRAQDETYALQGDSATPVQTPAVENQGGEVVEEQAPVATQVGAPSDQQQAAVAVESTPVVDEVKPLDPISDAGTGAVAQPATGDGSSGNDGNSQAPESNIAQ